MAENSRIYMFEFRGRAEIVRRRQGPDTPPNESAIVSHLNDNSFLIAKSIQDELMRGLSPSLSAQVQIHFSEGSITIAGIVILVDTIASLLTGSESVAVFARLLEIIIQRVVQSWIRDEINSADFTPSVRVDVQPPSQSQRSGWAALQNLERLMIANLVLMLILIFLLLRSILPAPEPPNGPSTFTPVSTSTFTATVTETLTNTPSPTVTSSPTSTPSLTPTPTLTPFS